MVGRETRKRSMSSVSEGRLPPSANISRTMSRRMASAMSSPLLGTRSGSLPARRAENLLLGLTGAWHGEHNTR